VTLTYEQALMSLRHFPDVWLELAAWHEAEGRAAEGAAVGQCRMTARLPQVDRRVTRG